jgi:predicted acetyltransferase
MVFGEDPRTADIEVFRQRIEFDRARAAFDGDEMVGTAGEFSYSMTLPGGDAVPTAGITFVTVKPTHRRRGVLTAMMRTQLEVVRELGEPLAALWASESAIYGRFDFGVAIEGASYTIDRRHTALAVDEPTHGRIRLIATDEARRLIPGIYALATEGIPGTLQRSEGDWKVYFHDPEHWRDGASATRFVIFEQDGEARGYARYRHKPKWEDQHPDHEIRVGELHALDAEAYAALHRYLFSIDLVTTIKLSNRRLHEPLRAMLVAPRRLRAKLSDHIWLRVMDVPAVLSARRYPAEGALTIEVVDDFMDFSGGRFLLEGGPDGAACSPTDREPDLVMSLADLSSAILGSARFGQLAWAGRVDGDPAAIRQAQTMFQWFIEPWCTVFF